MSINIKKDGKLVKIAPTSYNELTNLPNIESSGDVTYITDESGKNVATIGPGGLSTTGIVVDRITLDGEDVGSRLDEIKGEIDFNDLTNNPISDNNDGTVSFADENGNKIVLIDSDGVTSVEFKADSHKLTEKADQSYVEDQITRLEASAFSGDYNDLENAPIINDTTGSAVFADDQGNQIAKIDAEGVTSVEFIAGTHKLTNKAEKDALLADFTEDSEHQTVTSAEKTYWSNKSEFSGKFGDLTENPIDDDTSGKIEFTDGSNIIARIDESGIETTAVKIAEGDVATLIGTKADKTSLDATNNTISAVSSRVDGLNTELNNVKTDVTNDKAALETFKTEVANDFSEVDSKFEIVDNEITSLENITTDHSNRIEGIDASDGEFVITDGTNIALKVDSTGLLNVKDVNVAGGLVDERLKDIENYFSTEEDADNNLNKWHEIVDFLNGFEETDQVLENIINTKADKTTVEALDVAYKAADKTIGERIDGVEIAYKQADSDIITAYKAADTVLQNDINTRALQSSLDSTNQEVSKIKEDYVTKVALAAEVETNLLVTDAITLNDDEFIFADVSGNKIAQIDKDGIASTEFTSGSHKLTAKADQTYVDQKDTQLNETISSTATAIRGELTSSTNNLSTLISNVDKAYKAADVELQNDIDKRALQTSLDATNQEVSNVKATYVTKDELANKVTTKEVDTDLLVTDAITLNEDEFIFADDEGYKIAEINSTGITSVEFVAGEHQLTKKADKTYVDAQFSSTNASLESMASTIRNEFAEEDLKLSNKISEVETAYKAADADLQKDIDTRALQTSLDATNQKVSTIESTYATKAEIAEKVETDLLVADDITLNKSEFVFADKAGNKIAEINNTGVNSVDFIAGTHKLTEKANKSDVENQITSTNTSIETVASAIRKEFAAEDTKLSTKISEIDTAYKAEDIKIKEDVASRALQTSLDATNERVSDIENTYVTKEEIATKVETNLLVADDITLNKSEYVFSDVDGNKIAQIDSAGINSTEFTSGDHKLTSKADKTYVDQLNTNVGETINNTASAIRNEFKIKDDELSGKITKVETEYKAADTAIQEEVDKRALQTALDSTNQEVSNIKNNYVTKAEIAAEVDTAHLIADNITLNQSEYIFKDNTDKKIAQIDASGVSSTEFIAGSHQLTKKSDLSYVNEQIAATNTSLTSIASSIRKEFADEDTKLSVRIEEVDDAYQLADNDLQTQIDKKAAQTALDSTNSRLESVENDYVKKEELAKEVITEHLQADNLTTTDSNFIFFADPSGNKIAEINSDGVTSIEFIAGSHQLTEKADLSYVNDQITATNATVTSTATAIRSEFAAKDKELSNKINTVETNYKSADEIIKKEYAAADKIIDDRISSLDTSIKTSISTGSATVTGTLTADKIITDDLVLESDVYDFIDDNGKEIARIDASGITTTAVAIKEGDVATLIGEKVDTQTFNNSISRLDTNKVDNSALTETLKGYAKVGDIPSLDEYLKTTVADGKYATITTTDGLQNSINSMSTRIGTAESNITSVGDRVSTLEGFFDTAEDAGDIIDKWVDVVEFLDGMAEANTEGEKLASLLNAKANTTSLNDTNNRVTAIENNYATKAEIAAEVDTEHLIADNITTNQSEFIFFADPTGSKIATIDDDGVTSIEFIAVKDNTTHNLTEKANSSDLTAINNSITSLDSKVTKLTTDSVKEGTTNLYFTNARAVSALSNTLSGYVPTTRKINNKALSSNITLTASDVGAASTDEFNSLSTKVDGKFSTPSTKTLAGFGITDGVNTVVDTGSGTFVTDITIDKHNITLSRGNVSGFATSAQLESLDTSLHAVAKSGSYNDLNSKPTIPSAVYDSTVSGWGYMKTADANSAYAPASLVDTVNSLTVTDSKSTVDTSKQYYLCGSSANATGTDSTLYKRTDVYVNTSGSIYGKSFFETSDETLKNFSNNVEVDFEKLAKLPKKYFTWKDGDSENHIGTSAQEVQKIYPELVSEGSNGKLTVDYAKLSVIALSAIDKLYIKNLELEERLAKIETLLNNK